jgi:drug/metabolite transporter (DMT)-like permease
MQGIQISVTLISVFMIGCGQILFKLAARDTVAAGFTWETAFSLLSPAMFAALAVSMLATALWVWVLRSASLSLVYPLYALTFVVVPLLEWLFSGTRLTLHGAAGAVAIVAGVWMMTRGAG